MSIAALSVSFLIALPAAASGLLSLSSPFTGLLFYFDAANVYHRGPFFLVIVAASYAYLLFAFVLVAMSGDGQGLQRALTPSE